ncbi:hypothetical protein Fcan01_19949 [Folsomia candida]|uniref:Uncharacterized protein n=1 Tax=Folsomia candida TaxID=158441 RepID=A0A226DIM1_FOLCA|nr:hypothetical protein Fcan01_19949 [Folsomia candida]
MRGKSGHFSCNIDTFFKAGTFTNCDLVDIMTSGRELCTLFLMVALVIGLLHGLYTTSACNHGSQEYPSTQDEGWYEDDEYIYQEKGQGAMVTSSVEHKCAGGLHYSKRLGMCARWVKFARKVVG